MNQLLEITVFLLVAIISGLASGGWTMLFYFAIGEPSVVNDRKSVKGGRIFSFFGFWLAEKLEAFQKKRTEEIEEQIDPFFDEIIKAKLRVELIAQYPPTIWKIPVCTICSSFWVSLIVSFFALNFGGFPLLSFIYMFALVEAFCILTLYKY